MKEEELRAQHQVRQEESFDKFTDDIVKQFMKEEELRAQHQVRRRVLTSLQMILLNSS